jgi:murein DD-endopeptidase MepM/ murein hydrolase activator NlpD
MPLSLSTPIMGYRDIDIDVVLDHMDRPDDKDRRSLEAIKERSDRVGIDAGVPVSQFLVETGNGTSPRYTKQNALAGVGIVADDTVQPFVLDSVEESADLFIQCLYSLVNRKPHPGIVLKGDVKEWFDSVWMPKVRSSAMPNVTKVADLGLRYIENGDSRATWSWEQGTGSMDAYGLKLVSRLKEYYPNLPERSTPPVTPSEPVLTTTWQKQLDTMFGRGVWTITQEFGNDPIGAVYDDMYAYAEGHGLNGDEHPGLDVGMPYGTKMYAPADATVTCAGTGNGPGFHGMGCDAFNDWGNQCENLVTKQGVGHIQLLFDNGQALIYGHSRTCAVKPGDRVKRGQYLGTSGGMCGAHIHLEAMKWQNGTYWMFDPKILLESLPVTTEVPVPTLNPFSIIEALFVDAPVTKQRAGQGFSLGTRSIVGIIQHETQGRGTGWWYREFFSCPDGERCEDALVDYLIDREGKIFQFQDPFSSNRIPWASGGTKNYNNAIGKAINNKYADINKHYAAVEIVKTDEERMTAAQIESTARLTAYIMVRCGYPANDWKYPDKLGNTIATSANHSDVVTSTNCRIHDDDRAAFEKRCTDIMTAYYAGAGPAPEPPKPAPEVLAEGVDWDIAARCFNNEAYPGYVLTKGGPLSTLYIERAKATKEWPRLAEVWNYADGRRYFWFSNGWLAIDPPTDAVKVKWAGDPVQ